MATLNKTMIIGNLTRDPEIRMTASGTKVANIGMAVNRKYKDSAGNAQEETTFLDITLWERLAELAEKYLHKGKLIYLEGRLRMDTWEKDGQKRSKIIIVGHDIQFLDQKPSGDRRHGENCLQDPPPASERSQSLPAGRRQKQEDSFDQGFSKGDDVPLDF